MPFTEKNDRRDSISTMFQRSVSLCDAADDTVVAPTKYGANYERLKTPRNIETAHLSLERMMMFDKTAVMETAPITPLMAASNKKRVTFALPDSTGGDQSSNLSVTPRSSPQRKRRKFQRRNSKTPAMLLTAVTELQAQQEYQQKHNFHDEGIEFAEDLLAAMLQNQGNISNKTGPTIIPWNISLGDSPRKTRILVNSLPFSGICRSTS